MLINLLSWVLIFLILFTFGDMLLALYNKICKREELYNPIDKLLLGLCFLIIPLSLWSLWLPSDHVFLIIALIISANYWVINLRKAYTIYIAIRKALKDALSSWQWIAAIAFVLFSLFFFTWQQDVYDSLFYHFQHIRWNEEYAVVPGIANLDDRFGFNSNYFLLSAIFTFRTFLGEAIYPLQPFIVTMIGGWIVYELFKSKYEIKRCIILITYVLLFWVSIYFLGNTSTDILPNFITFYILARIVLYPKLLKENYLIGILLPVLLLTFKLSFFPVGLISIYLLYFLIKEKKYKVIFFLCLFSLLILIPWLIRNVIISGYLIYPLYQLDLFSFDWKVSHEIAMKEKDYIFNIGYYFFRIAVRYPHQSVRDPLAINILTDIVFILVAASFVIGSYLTLKKRKEIGNHIYLLYAIFFLSILIWATSGPDARFISGILCAIAFTGGILLYRNKNIHLPVLGRTIAVIFICSIALWAGSRYYTFCSDIKEHDTDIVSHVLVKPFSVKDQDMAKGIDISKRFTPYPINNDQFIWVSEGMPYDMLLPASIHSHYAKFLPLECIEARGYSIQDGYRAKENCK